VQIIEFKETSALSRILYCGHSTQYKHVLCNASSSSSLSEQSTSRILFGYAAIRWTKIRLNLQTF